MVGDDSAESDFKVLLDPLREVAEEGKAVEVRESVLWCARNGCSGRENDEGDEDDNGELFRDPSSTPEPSPITCMCMGNEASSEGGGGGGLLVNGIVESPAALFGVGVDETTDCLRSDATVGTLRRTAPRSCDLLRAMPLFPQSGEDGGEVKDEDLMGRCGSATA